jgi:hypothetical protein
MIATSMPTGNRLTDMEFDEISLVTRPANQLSKVVLYKSGEESMDDTEAEFGDTEDLEKDTAPDPSVVDKGHGAYDDDDEEDDEELLENLKTSPKKGAKMSKDAQAEMDSMIEYIEALETANSELMAKMDEAQEEESTEDSILKSADPAVVELIKAAEDRATVAEEIAKAERDHRLEREYIEKASEYASLPVDPTEFGPVLKAAADALDDEVFDHLIKVLTAANEAIRQGSTFDEIGKATTFDADSGIGKVEQIAKALQANEKGLSYEAAVAKAVMDDPTLYDNYLKESR